MLLGLVGWLGWLDGSLVGWIVGWFCWRATKLPVAPNKTPQNRGEYMEI